MARRIGVLTALLLLAALPAAAVTVRLRPPATRGACEVHVAALDGSAEVMAPCGQAIEVPRGEAVGWIEQPGLISRSTTDVTRGGDVVAPEPAPAAQVTIMPPRLLEGGEHGMLIALAARADAPLFARPVPRSAIAKRHAAPAGALLAVVLDGKRNALALSRPQRVAAGESARIAAKRNAQSSDLLVVLQRPAAASADALALTAALDGGAPRRPDVFVNAADAVVAVWYELAARSVRLALDSKTLRLPVDAVDLARGGVTTVRQRLVPLPTLTVAVAALPASVRPESVPPLALTVFKAGDDDTPIGARTAAVPGGTYEFPHLPAVSAVVLLEIGEFKSGERVDLSDGRDARIVFPLEPVPVAGTVFFGEEPAKAEVRFLQKGGFVSATSDGHGKYEITLWEERRYFVNILLLDRPAVPPIQEVVSVTANQTLDFHVPALRFAARVYDSDSGKPVPKASVIVRNAWTGARGPESSVRAFPSDALAITELPPQHAGTSEIRVTASGYLEAGPLIVPIDASMHERVVDVPMRRVGETVPIDVRLPDGTAAAGAEVAASTNAGDLVWRGTAGPDGRVDVPKMFDGTLLVVRHPRAASAALRLRGDATAPAVVALTEAAPPLRLTVAGPEESRAANFIIAWIGGVRLSGSAVGFATWSSGMSDIQHQWVARNLPPAPLRVLAAPAAALPQALAGAYDAIAPVVPYPWPANASIQPVR